MNLPQIALLAITMITLMYWCNSVSYNVVKKNAKGILIDCVFLIPFMIGLFIVVSYIKTQY